MSAVEYREMTRERIKKWRTENPEEYLKARKNNCEAIKEPESQELALFACINPVQPVMVIAKRLMDIAGFLHRKFKSRINIISIQFKAHLLMTSG